ncbi:hypothetical protein BGX38DRAFT_1325880 [Terfezia claveryi]|nr:hypothetical protein BGX38DRAFT_1325880 [Terfezia claveryi]
MVIPWFHIAEPSNYLVITGAGIETVRITKKPGSYHGKRCKKSPSPFRLLPRPASHDTRKKKTHAYRSVRVYYRPRGQARSIPVKKYASLLTGQSDGADRGAEASSSRNNVRRIVRGIIEGETRVLVSTMTVEEVFTNRALFKANVTNNVQTKLSKFGLIIVARTRLLRKHLLQSKQPISASTKIHAKRAQEARDAELQKDVEIKRVEMELERLRALDVTKAQIAKESSGQNADASHYLAVRNADAKLYHKAQEKAVEAAMFETQKKADNQHHAVIKAAEAAYTESQKKAEARFYQPTKEAEAVKRRGYRNAKAYQELAKAFGGSDGLLKYLMIERGVYSDLAKQNAAAVQGLQPKINGLPPMLAAVHEQTGMAPPAWMMQMPNREEVVLVKGKGTAVSASN